MSFKGFTTTFEELHGLAQLPALGVQRLMADGYGFGGEGDWKTASLVRILKVMAAGLPGACLALAGRSPPAGRPALCVRPGPGSPRW